MNRFRFVALALALVMFGINGAPTDAQPRASGLLGSKDSFFTAEFCRVYTCTLVHRQTLSTNIVEYGYKLGKTPTAEVGSTYADFITVLRVNGIVTSAGYVTGQQDYILSADIPTNPMIGTLITTLTGVRLSPERIANLEQVAINARERESRTALGNGAFVSVLVSSGTYLGASRFSLYVSR